MIARALELGPIVLASSSPRRREILGLLGIEFTVVAPDYDEAEIAGLGPAELAEAHARGKAAAVAGDRVLGVDTLVALDGAGVRKTARRGRGAVVPGSARGADAHRPLGPLPAGRRRRARPPCRERGDVRPALGRRRRAVPRDGEWRDRAGAYAVQGRGAALVRAVRGDFQNVVGLPVPELLDAMAAAVEAAG